MTGSVEMLQALRSERGNLWLASHVTGNYPLHEAAIARHIGTHHIFLLSKSFNYHFFSSSLNSVLIGYEQCQHAELLQSLCCSGGWHAVIVSVAFYCGLSVL